MKFQKEDMVVHEVYGVGKILDLEELAWTQPQPSNFYVVQVGDAKIWVPVEKQDECHLRPVTPREELPGYQKIFEETPAQLEENRYGRTTYIRQSKKHVSFRELCVTIRDLTSHNHKKKLADYEATFLERLTDQLIEEWALSAGISVQQAETKIRNLLQTIEYPGPLEEVEN